MPRRHLSLTAATAELSSLLGELRSELGIPLSFSAAAEADARAAAARPPVGADRLDIPFVTIDPPASRDLDQAVHIEDRGGEGFLVHYAISAVGTLVEPGSALDEEVHARGVTVYGPQGAFPLHPETLSAGAASLLPGAERTAYLWTMALDADAAACHTTVELARVRSRAKLSYAQVQRAADSSAGLPPGVPEDLPRLLRRVGELRGAVERARGGVSMDTPEQVVVRTNGGFRLEFRGNLPAESWNAQLSLLTGMEAARMMRAAGTGILRTLPPAQEAAIRRLRRVANALGIRWERTVGYPELVRSLDSAVPAHAAFLEAATELFRGAAYEWFDGGAPPRPLIHGAIAAEYAHVTAPLRRLVDRYGLEICLAHSRGEPVPADMRDRLPAVPGFMATGTRRAGAYERAAVDIVEALVLRGREGETFPGVILDVEERRRGPDQRGEVILRGLGIEGEVTGRALPLGEQVPVRLAEADPARRRVAFTLAEPPA